jgi:hypothetical protein
MTARIAIALLLAVVTPEETLFFQGVLMGAVVGIVVGYRWGCGKKEQTK